MDYRGRKSGQRAAAGKNECIWRREKKKKWTSEVSEQLLRLLICLGLFMAVFVGRGVFPEGILRVRDELLLTANTDFQVVLQEVGEAITGDKTLLEQVGDICVEVFGGEPEANEITPAPQLTSLWSAECRFLNDNPEPAVRTTHYTISSLFQLPERKEEVSLHQETAAVGEETAVPVAGTVILHSEYGGQPLPEGYTMDQLSLGELETVTPVIGRINSVYGYRDHPIDGRYQFHGGVDIGGQTGDPIMAFASGTVEYVGEDSSYGLYLQLDHGNGVKSFYAHCDSICVQKGQTVAVGEKIAEIGSSGAATGPHLHLELKYKDTHIDPIYYIEYLSAQ